MQLYNTIPESLNNCKTRYDLFTYCFAQYSNTSCRYKFCNTNIVMYINQSGYRNMDRKKFDDLRNKTNILMSFCMSDKFYRGEDLTFTYYETTGGCVYVPPPFDFNLYTPSKHQSDITILMTNPALGYEDQIQKILHSIQYLIDDNPLINFNIGIIDHKQLKKISLDGTIIQTINFENYLEYINEIAGANIVFFTSPVYDIYDLYECAMCNTYIVIPYFVETFIKNTFDVYNDTDINWNIIINKSMVCDTRTKLETENIYTWENMINIVNKSIEDIKDTIVNKSPETQKARYVHNLNIMNKSIPVITQIVEKKVEEPQPVKLKPVLQGSRRIK